MAAVFDYIQTQLDADGLIRYFGMRAALRRAGVDRPCTICIVEYNPREQPAALAEPTDRKIIMSSLDPTTGQTLAVAPDNEQDQLVTTVDTEPLPLTCKPKVTAPAGIPVLWEFTVRR